MITVDTKAIEELNEYFAAREKQPIRVFLATGGCSGARLALSVDDDVTGEDETFEKDTYTFVIKKDLHELVGDVTIGYNDMGFTVDSTRPLPQPEGGGCGGCTGCH